MVSECVVIQRGEKFIALVYPDFEEAHNLGFGDEDITNVMNQNLQNLNAAIPAYSKVAAIEIRKEEFAKTPKKSIKRYLYQES